jgi:tetratricopeptide (TPR) repeat protein
VAVFAVIVVGRHLLEILTGQNPVYFPLQFFVHYPLAYVAPLLALVLLLSLFSGVAIIRVTRLMVYAWALTLLPPLVDLLAGRSGEAIGYLRLRYQPPLEVFLRFFDPTAQFGGTTIGIRVETAAACLLGGLYVWLRRRGAARRRGSTLLRSAGAAAGVYVTALGFFTLPRLFESAAGILLGWEPDSLYGPAVFLRIPEPLDVQTADRLCILYLVPLCLLLGLAWLARADPPAASRILRQLHPQPAAVAAILTATGLLTGALVRSRLDGARLTPAPADLLAAAGLVAASVCGAWSARLAGKRWGDRSDTGEGRAAALALAVAAAAAALCSGAASATLLAAAYGLSWLVWAPPLHRRAHIIVAPVAAGLAAVAALGAGIGWAVQADALSLLPPRLASGAWLALALAALAGLGLRSRPRRQQTRRARSSVVVVPAVLGAALAIPLAAGAPAATSASCAAVALAALIPRLVRRPLPRLEAAVLPLALALGIAGSLSAPTTRAALVSTVVNRPKFLIVQAMALEREGRVEAAIAAYRRALERDPARPAVYARLGELLWLHQGDATRAREAYRTAIALDPSEVAARHHLALLLLEEGEAAEAARLLAEARSRAPRLAVLALDHAEALSRLPEQRRAAISAWRDYLALSAGRPEEEQHRIRARSRLRALESESASGNDPSGD